MNGVKQALTRLGRRIPVAGPAQLQHRQCCKFEQEGRIARRQTMYHAMLHEPSRPAWPAAPAPRTGPLPRRARRTRAAGPDAGTVFTCMRQRSRRPTTPSGSPTPSLAAASVRRSMRRGPAAHGTVAVHDRDVVRDDRMPVSGQACQERALSGTLAAQHDPGTTINLHGACVETLVAKPAGGHRRDGSQVRVHEFRGRRARRHGERARPPRRSISTCPPAPRRTSASSGRTHCKLASGSPMQVDSW